MSTTTSTGAKKISGSENWRNIFGIHNDTVSAYDEHIINHGNAIEEIENTLDNLIPHIDQETAAHVKGWMDDNIHEDPTVIIDKSLSTEDAAAEAKATGDAISDLNSAFIDEIGTYDISYEFTKRYRIKTNVGVGNIVDLTPVSSVSWEYVIIPVIHGETYVINAKGGSEGRAYAIIDASNKLLMVAGDGVTITDLILTIPSEGAKLIVNSDVTYANASVIKKQIIDKSYIDGKTEALKAVTLPPESTYSNQCYCVGTVVEVAEDTNIRTAIIPIRKKTRYSLQCANNNRFRLLLSNTLFTGTRITGNLVLLYDDSKSDVVFDSGNYEYLYAYVSNNSVECPITLQLISETGLQDQITDNKDDYDWLLYDRQDILYWSNCYIDLSVGVDNTVTTTPVSNVEYLFAITPCNAGDRYLITGHGANAPRLWGFVDSNYKLLKVAYDAETREDYLITAESNGYLISNVKKIYEYRLSKITKNNDKTKRIETNENAISETKGNTYETLFGWVYKAYISDGSTNIASVVDIENPTPNNSFAYQVLQVNKGDSYRITGVGGANGRLWAFLDTDKKLISRAYSSQKENNLIVTADSDGYLVVNILNEGQNFKLERVTKLKAHQKFNEINEFIYNPRIPLVEFNIEHTLDDVSSFITLVDFSSKQTMMDQIYTLFDGLVSQYSEYVTKYDAALYDGLTLSYPDYANGVSSGDETYLETPAYKTYLYKFESISNGAGNTKNSKKAKIFIICGTHSNEQASMLNIYILAKKLCEATEKKYFMMRSAFDFYILPVLNGYGVYHVNEGYGRLNANGVNLNRNFPIENWAKRGEGGADYTGPSAGSEFETQLVIALTQKIKPQLAIDHHCYFEENTQFYTYIGNPDHLHLAYQSLADCSYTFLHNLPYYFGVDYKLFIGNQYGEYAPARSVNHIDGMTVTWWDEHGVPISSIIEVAHNIRYINGQPTSGQHNDTNGPDTYAVVQYALTNQIMRYGGWVLKNIQIKW